MLSQIFLQVFYWLVPTLVTLFLCCLVERSIQALICSCGGTNRPYPLRAYPFAIVGVTIHEMGHALMALFFGHRITKIVFFGPNTATGTLGYIHHRWNSNNTFQSIGIGFIGVGPLFSGLFCILAASHVYFSSFDLLQIRGLLSEVANINLLTTLEMIIRLLRNFLSFLLIIYNSERTLLGTVLYLYFVISVSLYMIPGRSDLSRVYLCILVIYTLLTMLLLVAVLMHAHAFEGWITYFLYGLSVFNVLTIWGMLFGLLSAFVYWLIICSITLLGRITLSFIRKLSEKPRAFDVD